MTSEQPPFTSASFQRYLREGRLMGVRCDRCRHLSATPRGLCPSCHSRDLQWEALSGRGRLTTFTAISIPPTAMAERGYGRDNPYCSGIVTLEEGPRVSALIAGVDARNPESIALGLPVQVDFSDTEEHPSLVFQPR